MEEKVHLQLASLFVLGKIEQLFWSLGRGG